MNGAKHTGRIDEATMQALSANADSADAEMEFPTASWEQVRAAGVPAWSVPTEFGGLGLSGPERPPRL